mgnify:FL=1|jgi:hypothetical protein
MLENWVPKKNNSEIVFDSETFDFSKAILPPEQPDEKRIAGTK